MDKFNIHIDNIVPDHSILLWEFKFNNPIHYTDLGNFGKHT